MGRRWEMKTIYKMPKMSIEEFETAAIYFESELSYFPKEYSEAWDYDRLIGLVDELQGFFVRLNDGGINIQ